MLVKRYKPIVPYLLLVMGVTLCSIALFAVIVERRGIHWWTSAHYEKPTWSPDGNRILYLYSTSAADANSLVIIDGKSLFPKTIAQISLPANHLTSPSWRSNTEVSVFEEGFGLDRNPKPAVMYLYDLSSETWQAIEAPLPVAAGISWHPDGNEAFVSFQDFPPLTPPTMEPGIYRFTPDDQQFEFWQPAELPGAIAWSPDGRYVAYIDFITVADERPQHLNIIDVATGHRTQVILRTESSHSLWRGTGSSLSWSPDGKWLLTSGTIIQEPGSSHYSVMTGLYFLSPSNLTDTYFWEIPSNLVDFHWSPDGDKVVISTVTQPFTGKNFLRILDVPEKYP